MSLEQLTAELADTRKHFKKIVAKVKKYAAAMEAIDEHLRNGGAVSGPMAVRHTIMIEETIPTLSDRGIELHRRMAELKREISRVRQQDRCKVLKETLIAAAFHPIRIGKLLEKGGYEFVDATLGY